MDNKTNTQWFAEFEGHLTGDDKPSVYFDALMKDGAFPKSYPFGMLIALKAVPQSPVHHPEGNVWKHTMQVVDIAAGKRDESIDARVFMWAALLHDLGKEPTTRRRRGRITAYDHDKAGEVLARQFLDAVGADAAFTDAVAGLVRWHMQVLFVAKDMPFADLPAMMEDVTPDEIALLALCDRLGRGQLPHEKIEQEKRNVAAFLKKCESHAARATYL